MGIISKELNYDDFGIYKYDKFELKEDCDFGNEGDIGMVLAILEISGDRDGWNGVHVEFAFKNYEYDCHELYTIQDFKEMFEYMPNATPAPWTSLMPNWGERYVCVVDNWINIPVGQEVIVLGFSGDFVMYEHVDNQDGGGLLPKEFGEYFRQIG